MSEYDELLNQNEVFKDTLDKSTLFGPRPSVKISTIKTQCNLKITIRLRKVGTVYSGPLNYLIIKFNFL